MNRYTLITIFLCLTLAVMAQKESFDVMRGNREYHSEQYTDAEINYRKGLEKNNESFSALYNLGNSLFKQQKYEDAAKAYSDAAALLPQDRKQMTDAQHKTAGDTYHNLGNSFYGMQQYDKALAAYQEALRHCPNDNDTRYNLVKTMQMLQQQQEQEQQQAQEQEAQPQDDEQMDKEQAQQILQALEQDEQDTQEKAKRTQKQSRFRTDKDW
ncbi:MAG: tetratricopeptide repeat protein [Paludibacteraceae bacterium]|nr:tetratricopeptide repeat protein [Paludibacteraceae bacterium]